MNEKCLRNPPDGSRVLFFVAVAVFSLSAYALPAAAGELRTWVPRDGGCPWYDRIGKYAVPAVPEKYASATPVPQQACSAPRRLDLHADGLKAATIAVASTESAAFAKKLGLKPTGASLRLCAANGTPTRLAYDILIYPNPPRVTEFTGAKAGVMLLALTGVAAAGASRAPGPAAAASPLPEDMEFEAQEWPFEPGPRTVKMHVATPAAGITADTGIMLCLHNWGGRYDQPAYKAWCRAFADRYNVVAASVNYLQSGGGEPTVSGKKPYDHGYLQAMDCLRAIYHLRRRLAAAGVAFNPHRCYAMGGSGGGNVTLMVNKFAPHTFACVVDICGMPGLTDGIAYGTGEYGSHLNAGYSKDPGSPAYLTPDMQEIRNPGRPDHLAIQRKANPENKVVIVHGLDDRSCPAVHKITIFRNMAAAGFHPDGHFLTPRDVDGTVITTTGHPVGNRQKVTEKFADDYLLENGRLAASVPGPDDFERKGTVVYPTRNGRYVVDFTGPPTIRFEKN